MSCLSMFTKNLSIGLFVAGAITSIAISVWQYQSSPGDTKWYFSDDGSEINWDKQICEAWPYEYTRPFSVKCDDCKTSSYCGWSVESTGYRLCVAILTLVAAALLVSKKLDDRPELIYVMLLINAVFWGAVFVVDCTILTNSSLACNLGDFWISDGVTCNNELYGVTIAVDLIVTVITFLAWFVISGITSTSSTSTSNKGTTDTATRYGDKPTEMVNPVVMFKPDYL